MSRRHDNDTVARVAQALGQSMLPTRGSPDDGYSSQAVEVYDANGALTEDMMELARTALDAADAAGALCSAGAVSRVTATYGRPDLHEVAVAERGLVAVNFYPEREVPPPRRHVRHVVSCSFGPEGWVRVDCDNLVVRPVAGNAILIRNGGVMK